MDINNFVINRVRRATMFHSSTGEALWNITQVEDPQLSVTTDKVEAVDALGARIMEFERGKNAEFTATNTLFDFALASAQSGTDKKVAAAGATIGMPKWEEIELTAAQVDAGTVTLNSAPISSPTNSLKYIYKLNGDGTLAQKWEYAATAAAAKFTYSGTTLTLPTGDNLFAAGDRLWVPYEFAAADGVEVYNTAVDFPKAGKFVMEVLGNDVCDPSKEYYAYVVFPNAKLNSDFDLNFTTDGKHPFTLQAMQQYCDHEKKLFSIYIPEIVPGA